MLGGVLEAHQVPEVVGALFHDDRPAGDLAPGYGMLCRPNPERYLTRSFRVDMPFLRVRVVVVVNLSWSPGDIIRAALHVEHRA